MLRKILLTSAAVVVGYVVGVHAGFGAAVRDYVENDAEMIERIAIESDKYAYPDDESFDVEDIVSETSEANSSHQRTYQ